jgi:hypothetical protein
MAASCLRADGNDSSVERIGVEVSPQSARALPTAAEINRARIKNAVCYGTARVSVAE